MGHCKAWFTSIIQHYTGLYVRTAVTNIKAECCFRTATDVMLRR